MSISFDPSGQYRSQEIIAAPGLSRQALQAARPRLDHPVWGELLEIRVPLPVKLERLLATHLWSSYVRPSMRQCAGARSLEYARLATGAAFDLLFSCR